MFKGKHNILTWAKWTKYVHINLFGHTIQKYKMKKIKSNNILGMSEYRGM